MSTTIVLTEGDLAHGQVCHCYECPLALAIDRHLKPGYFAAVFYEFGSIQPRDGHIMNRIGSFDMPSKAREIISAIDHNKEIKTPCKVKIPLPKHALRIPKPTPRILPLP